LPLPRFRPAPSRRPPQGIAARGYYRRVTVIKSESWQRSASRVAAGFCIRAGGSRQKTEQLVAAERTKHKKHGPESAKDPGPVNNHSIDFTSSIPIFHQLRRQNNSPLLAPRLPKSPTIALLFASKLVSLVWHMRKQAEAPGKAIRLSTNTILNGKFVNAGEPLPVSRIEDLPPNLKPLVVTGDLELEEPEGYSLRRHRRQPARPAAPAQGGTPGGGTRSRS
jgi:hypothetical protein